MTLDRLLAAALSALVRGRRLEGLELLLLLLALPRLVAGIGLEGLGALALADAVVRLVLGHSARSTGPLVAGAAAAVLAVATALSGGAAGAPLAGLLVAALRAGPAWSLQRRLQRTATPQVRLLGGGAALARVAAAFALADRPEAVVVIGGAWLAVDVGAAWVAAVTSGRGPRASAAAAARGNERDARGDGDRAQPKALPAQARSPAGGPLWHLDAMVIAAVAGLGAVAPWAVGVWIIGRLTALSGIFERALSPLPVPGVPDGLAFQRACDAAAFLAVTLGVPVACYASDGARLLLHVDAPWLGLFGACLPLAAAMRCGQRAATLLGRPVASAPTALDLGLRLGVGGVAAAAVGAAGTLVVALLWTGTRATAALREAARSLPEAREALAGRLTRVLTVAALSAGLAGLLRSLAPPANGLELATHVSVVTVLAGVAAFATHHIAGGPGDSPIR